MPDFELRLQAKENYSPNVNWDNTKKIDYFLCLEGKKVKLKHNFVKCSPYIRRLINDLQQKNNLNCEENCALKLKNTQYFQLQIIELISKILDGQLVFIRRNQEIIKLIRVSFILQLQQLVNLMLSDIEQNFEHYGFFTLFSVSRQFHLEWLKIKCQRQLILDNFEGINYNRYDLILLPQVIFREVFILHFQCVKQGKCKGQPNFIIKDVFQAYSEANSIVMTPIFFNLSQLDSIPEVEQVDSPKFVPQSSYRRYEAFVKQQTLLSFQSPYNMDSSQMLQNPEKNFIKLFQNTILERHQVLEQIKINHNMKKFTK